MHNLYHHSARGLRLLLAVVATPLLLFVLAGVLLYCPPIQRWAVDKACQWAERETGYRVSIQQVRLAFPLDLVLGDVVVVDAEADTLLRCRALDLSVPVRPLLDCRVDVSAFTLTRARINTKSLISDTHVEGELAYASITTHGYAWPDNHISNLRADLRGADFFVVLTDTAAEDTTKSSPWLIELTHARLHDSRLRLQMPGDTATVDIRIHEALARGGRFDTGAPCYDLHNLSLTTAPSCYADYVLPALNVALDTIGYANDRLHAAATLHTHYVAPWFDDDLTLHASIAGQLSDITYSAHLSAPKYIEATASGRLVDILDDARRGTARVSLTSAERMNLIVHHFAGPDLCVPAGSKLSGEISFHTFDQLKADVRLVSAGGSAAVKGTVNLSTEQYILSGTTRRLPIRAFVPSLSDVKPLTASFSVRGCDYSRLPEWGSADVRARIASFAYAQYPLDNTRLNGSLKQGEIALAFDMRNAMLQGQGTLQANMKHMLTQSQRGYSARVDACVDAFCPYVVGLMSDSLTLAARFSATANLSRDLHTLFSGGCLDELCFITPDTLVRARDLDYEISLSPDTTDFNVASGDLRLAFTSAGSPDSVVARGLRFSDELVCQLRERQINQSKLLPLLPQARLSLTAQRQNPLAALLGMKGVEMTTLDLRLDAHPEDGLSGWVRSGALRVAGVPIDTIYGSLFQDSTGVQLLTRIENYREDNPNRFRASIDGYMLSQGAGADIVLRDDKGETGIDIGMQANVLEDGLRISFYPRRPIVAYQRFTLNDDNFIFLGRDSTLRADIELITDEGTGLKIYGEPTPEGDNDITVSLKRLDLSRLADVFLWMPALSGSLSGDFHVTDASNVLSAMASLEVDDLAYQGVDVGRISTEVLYLPKEHGEHYAEAYLSANGREVLQARGSYFSRGEGSFRGDVHLDSIPLALANPFLADLGVELRGSAVGDFHAEGPLDRPVMNGSMLFANAHVASPAYGVDFRMEEHPVEIKDSRLVFDDFALLTQGKTPFLINGIVDARDLSQVGIKLDMTTRNFELINAPRTRQSLVFGKVYTDFDGTVRGDLRSLRVDGNLSVLDRTDVTYILRDTPVSVKDEYEGLVSFVDFTDTTTVVEPEEQGMNLDVNIGVHISDAARLQCLLAEDGSSYVNLMGGGDLAMRYTRQDELLLTGRYTMQEGEMKYELPVVPLKTFSIAQGSYVEFTGDILNPTLHITATESMKASVSDDAGQRSVRFVVGVIISQTLADMGLEFLVEAPDDAGIQNDLTSMTPLQRNKTAVALMATGMYMNEDVSSLASGLKGSNALNMFLQSSIQNIAGAARNTIDINFDIDSSTSASGATSTNYNFAFAKRFWGDRISVIIGGKVSAGADAENTAASIIDNISVEYRLDKGATRYVRAFYDRSAQDMLEGRLMKTGVGLVLRRKTSRLGELFLFRSK